MKVHAALLTSFLLGCPSGSPKPTDTATSATGAKTENRIEPSSSARPQPKAGHTVDPATDYRVLVEKLAESKATSGCLFDDGALGSRRLDVKGAKTSLVHFAKVAGSPTFSIGLRTPHGSTRQVTREAFDTGTAGAGVDHWFATVTPVSVGAMQQRVVPVLWVTSEAVWFSAIVASGVIGETWEQLEGATLGEFHSMVPKMSSIIVTADPDTSLRRIQEALTLAKVGALEIALAMTTPAPAAGRDDGVVDHIKTLPKGTPGVCRTGIGDIPKGMKPGSGIGVMRRADDFDAKLAKACADVVPEASPGGGMHVSMRVMQNGKVSEACINKDPIGDAKLRTCIVEQAKAYRFPKLPDGDFQNIGLLVTLKPPGGVVTGFCSEK